MGVLAVGQLTEEIARRLAGLGRVAVEGEVGQVKHAGSGHVYFTLKDNQATIACAAWRSRVTPELRERLVEGRQVVCHGTVDVYKPRGSYSLIVERVEPRGMGELLARLEVLKAELRERGYFDRARAVPAMPATVGVVTSRDADALRDFLATRSLRFAQYPVRLRHTRVQGPGSAQEVAGAIADLDASGVDVICVVRGGGSLEDLWTFNELPVAEAIWRCSVPVVSGVGHESDTTLADLVADHRAHTPTKAAEMVIPDRAALEAMLERSAAYLGRALDRVIDQRQTRLDDLGRRRALRDGGGPIEDRSAALERASQRLRLSLEARLTQAKERLARRGAELDRCSPLAWLERGGGQLEALAKRLEHVGDGTLGSREGRLDVIDRALAAVSPLAVLGRGYSITRLSDDRVLRSAADVQPGDTLETLLAEGRVLSQVQAEKSP